jgi:hypothetical protein
MMNDTEIQKITEFFSKDFFYKLENIAILQHDNGSYEFFNKYIILKEKKYYRLIYKYNSTEKLFSSIKNAVAYCIFEERNKFYEAERIEYLDQMLSGKDLSISHYRKLIGKTTDLETKLIYLAKLTEEENKKKLFTEELLGYIQESNVYQTKKFAAKR